MAQWPATPEWTEEGNINGGQQYEPADGLVNVDLNNLIINLLYLKLKTDTIKDSTAYRYKGSVQTYTQLLSVTVKETGDVYNVVEADSERNILAGANFAWNGTDWDNLGGIIDMANFIVDSLTSTDVKKALSAKMGKQLNDEKLNKSDLPGVATTTTAGFMSAADKAKLDTIEEGATAGGSGGSVDVEFDHIETITGEELKFFVGTKNEYLALSPEKKKNLFALFTDDIKTSDVRGNGTGFTYTLPTSTNLNSFMEEGHFFIKDGSNGTPLDKLGISIKNGFLDVDCFYNDESSAFDSGAHVFKQTFRDYHENDVYVRTMHNNEWGDWQKLINHEDVATQLYAGLMSAEDKKKLDNLSSEPGKIYRNDIKISGQWTSGSSTYNTSVYLQIYRSYQIPSNTSVILSEIRKLEKFGGFSIPAAGFVGWDDYSSPVVCLDIHNEGISVRYYDAQNGKFKSSRQLAALDSLTSTCESEII